MKRFMTWIFRFFRRKNKQEYSPQVIVPQEPPARIHVIRETYSDKTTIGKLYIDSEWFHKIWTLEDTVRKDGIKIYGKTAIPQGIYRVIIRESPSYKRLMPYLLNVPNFKNIMIHTGNKEQDTNGCILIGMDKGVDTIWRSREAFDLFYPEVEALCMKGDTFVRVH